MTPPTAPVAARFAYGPGPLQFGDLTAPARQGVDGPLPVVVFIHGGFWRNTYGLELAEPQAADAAASGFVTWNIEYRRVGDAGGGYPGTLLDVAAAVDHLAQLAGPGVDLDLDLDRIAIVGHSAGGHLAFWAGQREALPTGAPGADPAVVPRLVVGQAPVADLGANLDLGDGAVGAFIGSDAGDDPFAWADPARLLPVRVPQLLVQGGDDTIVPPDRAEAYAALVQDPLALSVELFAGADHFDVIDPDHGSWELVKDRLTRALDP